MFDRNSAEFRHLGLFVGSIFFFPIPINPPLPPPLVSPPGADKEEESVGDVMDDVTVEFPDVIDDVDRRSGIVETVFPSSETMVLPSWWRSFFLKFVGPLMFRKSISSGSSVLVLKKRLIVIFLRFWSLPSFASFEDTLRFVVEVELELEMEDESESGSEADDDNPVVDVVEGGGGDTALRDVLPLTPNDAPDVSIAEDDEYAL